MRLDKYSGIDPYTYPNGVLKNKHHIQDEKLLEELERITVATRIVQLRENPIKGNFDLAHLRKIHRHLFQDIYGWAGKIRTVDISKGNSRFCSYHLIQSYSETIAKKFKQQQWQDIAPEQFSEQSAYFLGEYNAVHPFREGNGRAIREMIGQLAKQNGYDIHWENITQEQMIKASEVSTTLGNNQLLKQLILDNIQVRQSEQQQNFSVLIIEERLTQARQLFKSKVDKLSPTERNKILAYEKGASEIWERLPDEKTRNALATNFYTNAARCIENGEKLPPAMSNATAKDALENRRENNEPDINIDDDIEIDR